MGNKLVINEHFELEKGNNVQVYLPASGKDFMFINSSTGFSAKLLGKVAAVAGAYLFTKSVNYAVKLYENIKLLNQTTEQTTNEVS